MSRRYHKNLNCVDIYLLYEDMLQLKRMRCSQTLNPSVKPYGCDNVMGKAIIPFYMLGLG
jgi:hypothetical protein